jgi:glycosyltransferase involved in cell wall biosynthesis
VNGAPARRVTLMTEIPAPFRIPLFNALASTPDILLEVVFLADSDPRRNYRVDPAELGFRWQTLPGASVLHRSRWLMLNRRIGRVLAETRPDVLVIGGWNQPAFWQGFWRATRRRIPVVIWVESTAHDARPNSGPLDAAKRFLIRRSTAFIVPGQASAAYLRALGAGDTTIAIARNAVDMTIFRERVSVARADRERIRADLRLERQTILYVGRLEPEKGLDVLFEAVRDLEAEVVLVGIGGEEERLRGLAPPNVRFIGWLDRDDLVPWYAAADVFVLPSVSEPWGMVINEAAAAALPIVSTTAVGAAFELVDDGVNGFRVEPGDAVGLHIALRRLVDDPDLRRAAGIRSSALADTHRPEDWAASVGELVRSLRP